VWRRRRQWPKRGKFAMAPHPMHNIGPGLSTAPAAAADSAAMSADPTISGVAPSPGAPNPTMSLPPPAVFGTREEGTGGESPAPPPALARAPTVAITATTGRRTSQPVRARSSRWGFGSDHPGHESGSLGRHNAAVEEGGEGGGGEELRCRKHPPGPWPTLLQPQGVAQPSPTLP
jgi:hypothetical protein